MGFFSLFKKDPEVELTRVETMIKQGKVLEKALKLATKLESNSSAIISSQAAALADQARSELVRQALENGKRSKASGNVADAIDWMSSALIYLKDVRRDELQQQIDDLQHQLDDGPRSLISATLEDGDGPENIDIDFEMHFEMLIGMLEPEVADRYRGLPLEFHQAYVSLNKGEVESARSQIIDLLKSHADHPILLLERARCAIVENDAETARDCLERCWHTLGDGNLDDAGTLSVPGLWGEVMLTLQRPEVVIDRLDALAQPNNKRPHLCQIYALALEAANRLEEAKAFLVVAGTSFTRNPNFHFLLARVMEQKGETQGAIDVLERLVGPSCGSGNCGGQIKHPASIRLLVSLYLAHDLNKSRVGDLLLHLEEALQGRLSRQDLMMAAVYHRKCGDEMGAAHAEEAAARLSSLEGSGLEIDVTKSVASGEAAIL